MVDTSQENLEQLAKDLILSTRYESRQAAAELLLFFSKIHNRSSEEVEKLATLAENTFRNPNDRFNEIAPILRELLKRAEKAEAECVALRDTLDAWFGLRQQLQDEIGPILKSALDGYLRTSENGGMPTSTSNAVRAVFNDFCRLEGVGDVLHKPVRDLRSERDELKALVANMKEATDRLYSFIGSSAIGYGFGISHYELSLRTDESDLRSTACQITKWQHNELTNIKMEIRKLLPLHPE